jgi:hypothetical protein
MSWFHKFFKNFFLMVWFLFFFQLIFQLIDFKLLILSLYFHFSFSRFILFSFHFLKFFSVLLALCFLKL